MTLTQDELDQITTELHVCYQEIEIGNLSEWECSFIESIDEQFIDSRFLSIKQREILKKIYDKVA